MPAQLDPPGHLAVHLEVIALTPILLCWAGALAGAITGAGRTARIFAAIGIALGLALLLLDLRSRGFALAVDRVLGREWFPPGLVRVSWPTMAAAALAGSWSLIASLRKQRSLPHPIDAWSCGLAQALALVPLPALVLFCLKNPETAIDTRSHRLLIVTAVIMTVAAIATASPWPHAFTALVGIFICKPWRVVLLIAALAACWPLGDAPA